MTRSKHNKLAASAHIDERLISACLQQLFSDTMPGLIEAVRQNSKPVFIRRGQVLFRQGVAGDEMYLVVRGRLRMTVRSAEGEQLLSAEVPRFQTIGEIALYTKHDRTATVVALRDSVLLQISRAQFESLSRSWPEFSLQVGRLIVNRLANQSLGRHLQATNATVLAVVSTGAGVNLDNFHRQLCTALEPLGKTLSIDEATVIKELRARGLDRLSDRHAHMLLAEWLDELESSYDFVVCHGGTIDSRWARHCARYADRMVLVGNLDTRQTLAALNAPMFVGVRVECELVRLHCGDYKNVRDTQLLLDTGRVSRHHHICESDLDGLPRLARYLSGRAVGLVLAGGGARGFAHIGVIRAIREHGIPIDYVGGTSIGAIIAAFVAMGMNDDDLHETSRHVFLTERPLRDYTLPLLSLIKGNRIDRLLREHTSEREIPDLWLNYFCVSASLTTNQQVIHEEGELWRAIRASISLPGILPPMVRDGELLVDGGLVNNLPVDVMLAKGVGHTIAVDLQGNAEELRVNGAELPGGTALLKRRLLPFADAAVDAPPGIFEIMLRASLLGSAGQSQHNRTVADIYLNPPVEDFGLLQFKSFDEIVAAGYEYASQQMDDKGWALIR
jgi:predicted acylesterase/phospholipase RssA/CRP-like cAMP-binding protein